MDRLYILRNMAEGEVVKRLKKREDDGTLSLSVDQMAFIARQVAREMSSSTAIPSPEPTIPSSLFSPPAFLRELRDRFTGRPQGTEEKALIGFLGPYVRNSVKVEEVLILPRCEATMYTFYLIKAIDQDLFHRLLKQQPKVVNLTLDEGQEEGENALKIILSTDPRVADHFTEKMLARLRKVELSTRTFLAQDQGTDPVGDMLMRCFDKVYFTKDAEKRETVVQGREVAILPIELELPVDLGQIFQVETFPAFQGWRLIPAPKGNKQLSRLSLSVFVKPVKKRNRDDE